MNWEFFIYYHDSFSFPAKISQSNNMDFVNAFSIFIHNLSGFLLNLDKTASLPFEEEYPLAEQSSIQVIGSN